MNKKKTYILLILIVVFILTLSYKKNVEAKVTTNNNVFFTSSTTKEEKLKVKIDKTDPTKATISIKNITEADKELEAILIVKNDNNKLPSTIKNLEVSGDSPDYLVRDASFPDGAKKITLSPKETTTVKVKIKIKEVPKDNENIKLYISFTTQ